MARNAADALVKKNNKLEAFLKKALDADTFEKIRAYDSCIVCSDKEDKAYKYVVISDEWVYLTENPPKKVQEAVHLRDIVSVELKNDFPDFLSGEERENTQHIVIKYMTKVRKGSKKKNKENDSTPQLTLRTTRSYSVFEGSQTARSTFQARNSIAVDRMAYSARESKSFRTPLASSRSLPGDIKSLKSLDLSKKKKSSGSGNFLSVPGQDDLNTNRSNANDVRSRNSRKLRTKSCDPVTLKKSLQGVQKSQLSVIKSSSNESLSGNLASTMLNTYTSSKYDKVRNLPRKLPNPADEWDENGELYDKRKKEPLRLTFSGQGDLHLSLENDVKSSEEESNEEEDSDDGDVMLLVPQTKVPPLNLQKTNEEAEDDQSGVDIVREVETAKSGCGPCGKKKKYSTMETEDTYLLDNDQLDWTTRTMDSATSANSIVIENGEKRRETALHLYIVSYSSPMLMLTRCAWNNYLIRATLEVDPEYVFKKQAFGGTTRSQGTSEKMEQLFNGLRTDLMNSENEMIDTFQLISELKSAAERTFAIKKLFWKNSELFTFIVRQLQKYLPKSPNITGLSHDQAKSIRADEFELLIVLVETLTVMFRETETLPSRFPTLKAGKGKATLDLVVVLSCCPEIPVTEAPVSARRRSSNSKVQWESYTDVELCQLVDEFTNISAMVFYELILIAHQANWGDTYGSFFNICWLVKVLEELNSTEQFVDRIVKQAMKLISPSRHEELSPSDALLTFELFSVIQTLLEYSPKFTDFIRTNFYEEFKYYIQAPIITKKLPKKYVIRKYTIQLIQECTSVILQKKVKLVADNEL